MKIRTAVGVILYADVPVGTILWAFHIGAIDGPSRFLGILGRVAVSYMAAMAIATFGIEKIAMLHNNSAGKLKALALIARYLVFVVAFFASLFVIGYRAARIFNGRWRELLPHVVASVGVYTRRSRHVAR